MNVYLLLEGRRTEPIVYPEWLSYLIPNLKQVSEFDRVVENNYYLFSSNGYPTILNDIVNAVNDINDVNKYDYFVVCIDSDEMTLEETENLIIRKLEDNNIVLKNTELKVIVQNRCFETWFLGNRKVYKRNPITDEFKKCAEFYNVCDNDPEEMQKPYNYGKSISQYHSYYLRHMFMERGISHSKRYPGIVQNREYLNELKKRITDYPEHLKSFAKFINFCEEIKEKSII